MKYFRACVGSFLVWFKNYDVYSTSAKHLSHGMTPPTLKMNLLLEKTQISLGMPSAWSESVLCVQRENKDQSLFHPESEDWSDWADVYADLILLVTHSWIIIEPGHVISNNVAFWQV